MITAHIPSGYVLAETRGWRGPVMAAAVVGAAWPDFDLLFFYLVDNRAFHQHRYWVHVPAFALAASLALVLAARRFRPGPAGPAVAFGAGWGLHLLLDSVAGSIMWLWPLSDRLFVLVEVPPTRSHWVLSFLTHWTVFMEVGFWLAATALYLQRRRV